MKGYCIMNIYEKIFARLDELHMSQIELSRRTGIATSTISDWRKKKINPQADKLVDQVASMIIDGYKYDMIASDKHKYLVALYSTGISVIKTSSVKSDHLLYKIKDDE